MSEPEPSRTKAGVARAGRIALLAVTAALGLAGVLYAKPLLYAAMAIPLGSVLILQRRAGLLSQGRAVVLAATMGVLIAAVTLSMSWQLKHDADAREYAATRFEIALVSGDEVSAKLLVHPDAHPWAELTRAFSAALHQRGLWLAEDPPLFVDGTYVFQLSPALAGVSLLVRVGEGPAGGWSVVWFETDPLLPLDPNDLPPGTPGAAPTA